MSERSAMEVIAEMMKAMSEYVELLESANTAISKQLLNVIDMFNKSGSEEVTHDLNEIAIFQLNAGLFATQREEIRKDIKRLSDELDTIL